MNWLDKKYIEGIKPVDVNNPKFPVDTLVQTLVDERDIPAGAKCRVMAVFPGGYYILWGREVVKDGVPQGVVERMCYLGEHCLKHWEE